MNKYYLQWPEYIDLIKELANKLKEQKAEFISGVPRGGLIPAVMISHILNIPLLELALIGRNRLGLWVIDDIYDTGKTLHFYRIRGYNIACIHVRAGKEKEIKLYCKSTKKRIIYPYEKN